MKIHPLIAGALVLLVAACTTRARQEDATLYYGFARVDPERERIIENAYVVVADGKISRMGSGTPPTLAYAERRDMSGLYATPGLFDTHAHVPLGPIKIDQSGGAPVIGIDFNNNVALRNGLLLLAHGVTTTRDPGGNAEVNVAHREKAASGEVFAPEAKVAGPVIDRSPLPFIGLSNNVDDANPIEAVVNRQVDAGVDYIKLYYGLTADDVARGVAAAHARGRKTIGHLSIGWTKAVELGVDALVHAMPASADLLEPGAREEYLAAGRPPAFAFFEWWEKADLDGPLITNMIAKVAERRTPLDATLIVFYLAFWGDEPSVRDQYVSLAHPAMVANWNAFFRFDAGWTAEDYRRAKAVWPKIARFVAMLNEAGVRLTLGTDLGNPFVAPGASLVQEMDLHHDAGISSWAILRMATSDAAAALDLSAKTGRIAKGLDADIVFTTANPVLNLDAFLDAKAVVHNGAYLDAKLLKEHALAVKD